MLAACFHVFPATAEELTPKLDDLVKHFGQVLFGDEYGVSDKSAVVSKWRGESVGIAVQGRQTKELVDLAAKHVRGLTRLTGVQFKTVKPGHDGPNIDLIFLKRAEMAGLSKQLPPREAKSVQTMTSDPTMVCFFLSWHKPEDTIVKAMVVVNVERDAQGIDSCLLEELTQVMGLPNDVDAYWPTLFNNLDRSQNWSRWDELYLRTLYDDRLAPGMPADKALEQARLMFASELSKPAQ
ncbi:MAG: DUF2927 domain-containing protein [Alphaproteobacteria bacterium]|nr:DUF2927 domain-containing protein [Alphaproteobacteria bacterium]